MHTHQQQYSGPDSATQVLTKRWADLCRADPAGFGVAMRRADQLQRGGVSRDEAMRQLLDVPS